MYSLTNQIRKAGVSVPSNIAEGQAQGTTRSFIHHLGIAYGSLCEVETQACNAARRRYVESQALDELMKLSADVGRLIHGLMRSLRDSRHPMSDR